ncbi:MAG: hypothetical protein ABR501_09895 [Pyrinomonadaceae bacterium]
MSRTVSVSVLMLLIISSANAYTVVMRSGRRVEIPSTFVLTPTTLTYEVSQGIQISLQVATINIPATELANNEGPGSFLKRMQLATVTPVEQEPSSEAEPVARATKTITNRDLAWSMQRRRESEVAYERRRRELGLPSIQESRRRAAAESEVIGRELEETLGAERESESYWRARASALRADIAAVDAEISYTRARLDEIASLDSNGVFNSVDTYDPFGPFGNIDDYPPNYRNRRSGRVYIDPRTPNQIPSRDGYGDRRRRGRRGYNRWPNNQGPYYGQGPYNQGPFPQARPTWGSPYPIYPNVGPYGSTQPYDSTYERTTLVTRLNELTAARAGLSARWRELEDEARRAGAYPGWLRP